MKHQKLKSLRSQIDCCDEELVKLLKRRFSIVADIGLIKEELNLPVLDNSRFNIILDRAKISAERIDLDTDIVVDVLKAIHKYSSKTVDNTIL